MYDTCNRYVIWDYILLCPKSQLLLLLLPVHNDSITITKYPVIVTIIITITYYYYPSPATHHRCLVDLHVFEINIHILAKGRDNTI